jgi:geranylgeranyl diphosphate synthase, type II
MHSPEELKALVDEALERLDLWPELHGQATSVRYALEVGGKRVRPVITLAVGEALGAPVEQVMPAALAIELVHTFSLVHDDLPAMDDDEERRGHPSTWKKFGEGVGVLAGDALLGEAVRLAARYESSAVTRELAEATLGMIGGQYLDTMVEGYDLAAVHRLKTGRLFYASVTMALWAAALPEAEQAPWRSFAEELGLLFQIVDDILDADGYVREHGTEGARRYADEAADQARSRLAEVDADTSVLRDIVDGLAVRTAPSWWRPVEESASGRASCSATAPTRCAARDAGRFSRRGRTDSPAGATSGTGNSCSCP